MKGSTIFLLLLFSLLFGTLEGQSHDTEHEHEFKKVRVAIAIGHAYIPSADLGSDAKVTIIPTWGVDLQYWFNPQFGIALKSDLEIANYTVKYNPEDSGTLFRKTPLILSLPALFSPWDNGLTFLLGPGMEFEKKKDLFVLRAGVGYEVELNKHWDFAPELVYDFKGGHINSLTLAITVGKRF